MPILFPVNSEKTNLFSVKRNFDHSFPPFTTAVTGIERDFCNTYLDNTIRRKLAQSEGWKVHYQATKTDKNETHVKHAT